MAIEIKYQPAAATVGGLAGLAGSAQYMQQLYPQLVQQQQFAAQQQQQRDMAMFEAAVRERAQQQQFSQQAALQQLQSQAALQQEWMQQQGAYARTAADNAYRDQIAAQNIAARQQLAAQNNAAQDMRMQRNAAMRTELAEIAARSKLGISTQEDENRLRRLAMQLESGSANLNARLEANAALRTQLAQDAQASRQQMLDQQEAGRTARLAMGLDANRENVETRMEAAKERMAQKFVSQENILRLEAALNMERDEAKNQASDALQARKLAAMSEQADAAAGRAATQAEYKARLEIAKNPIGWANQLHQAQLQAGAQFTDEQNRQRSAIAASIQSVTNATNLSPAVKAQIIGDKLKELGDIQPPQAPTISQQFDQSTLRVNGKVFQKNRHGDWEKLDETTAPQEVDLNGQKYVLVPKGVALIDPTTGDVVGKPATSKAPLQAFTQWQATAMQSQNYENWTEEVKAASFATAARIPYAEALDTIRAMGGNTFGLQSPQPPAQGTSVPSTPAPPQTPANVPPGAAASPGPQVPAASTGPTPGPQASPPPLVAEPKATLNLKSQLLPDNTPVPGSRLFSIQQNPRNHLEQWSAVVASVKGGIVPTDTPVVDYPSSIDENSKPFPANIGERASKIGREDLSVPNAAAALAAEPEFVARIIPRYRQAWALNPQQIQSLRSTNLVEFVRASNAANILVQAGTQMGGVPEDLRADYIAAQNFAIRALSLLRPKENPK